MKLLQSLVVFAALAGISGAAAADALVDAHAVADVPPFVTERVDLVVTFPEAPRPGRAG